MAPRQTSKLRISSALFVTALFAANVLVAPGARASHSAYHVVKNDWNLWWSFTQTDGLRVRDALYKGRRVFWSGMTIAQVDPHYTCCGYTLHDQLGTGPTGDGTLVPYVAGSAQVIDLGAGFEITATFSQWPNNIPVDCTYKYIVRYRFFATGIISPWLEVHGPGCESAGAVYYVYWRMDFDIEGGPGDYFQKHGTTSWSQPADEHWYYDDGIHDPSGYEWRLYDGTTSKSFWTRPYPPDNADYYALHYVSGEGNGELSFLTYPSAFHNHDAGIQQTDNVVWYIARITFTCAVFPSACGSPVIPGPTIDATGF